MSIQQLQGAELPCFGSIEYYDIKGELSPEQALFMAPTKPEYELFDLENDPWELNNLAENPDHKQTKDKLLAALNNWRENVFYNKGVTEAYRNGGWFAKYPTKTLEEWEEVLEKFSPWVYRKPRVSMEQPFYPRNK